MNDKKFKIVKIYTGLDFVGYVLNHDNIESLNKPIEEINFSKEQLEVLVILYELIKKLRIRSAENDNIGDSVRYDFISLEYEDDNLYNGLRRSCGGMFPKIETEDPLLKFIKEKCVKVYPDMLFVPKGIDNHHVLVMNEGSNTFIQLVKNDELDNLTNKAEGLDYSFSFLLDNGLSYYQQVSISYTNLIQRAFHNCCNRQRYDLQSVLTELQNEIESLRNLSKGNKVYFSSFQGVKGFKLIGDSKYSYKNLIVRNIKSASNPSYLVKKTISRNKQGISGGLIEIVHTTKLKEVNPSNSKAEWSMFYSVHDNMISKLQFAIIFTLLVDKAFHLSAYENGFFLEHFGNFSYSQDSPKKYLEVNKKEFQTITDWLSILLNNDLKNVDVSLKRLKSAIFERNIPEDSIIDGVIAWEGLFSEAFETTLKVTGSIASLIYEKDERVEKYQRLKKLYGLRSELVHGGNIGKKSLLKKEDVNNLREEVIKIGLECLRKILNDKKLLNMSASERITEILVMK